MDFKSPYEVFERYDFAKGTYDSARLPSHTSNSNSSNASQPIPTISVGSGVDAGTPVNSELMSKSSDIKKQLSQSFHANGGVSSGGVTKPHSRRNSAYHIKSENDNEDDSSKGDQGNERKRRDNINDKIQELLTLIPASYFQEQEGAGGSAGGGGGGGGGGVGAAYDDVSNKAAGTKDGKPNKGQILTQAVEYIQHLQNLIDENNKKEVELYLRMKTLQLKKEGKENVPISVGATSAEVALGEIGVGPHSEKYFKDVLLDSHTGEE